MGGHGPQGSIPRVIAPMLLPRFGHEVALCRPTVLLRPAQRSNGELTTVEILSGRRPAASEGRAPRRCAGPQRRELTVLVPDGEHAQVGLGVRGGTYRGTATVGRQPGLVQTGSRSKRRPDVPAMTVGRRSNGTARARPAQHADEARRVGRPDRRGWGMSTQPLKHERVLLPNMRPSAERT